MINYERKKNRCNNDKLRMNAKIYMMSCPWNRILGLYVGGWRHDANAHGTYIHIYIYVYIYIYIYINTYIYI